MKTGEKFDFQFCGNEIILLNGDIADACVPLFQQKKKQKKSKEALISCPSNVHFKFNCWSWNTDPYYL